MLKDIAGLIAAEQQGIVESYHDVWHQQGCVTEL
jgi:hypothetical protein